MLFGVGSAGSNEGRTHGQANSMAVGNHPSWMLGPFAVKIIISDLNFISSEGSQMEAPESCLGSTSIYLENFKS